jgi:hypothetical protein
MDMVVVVDSGEAWSYVNRSSGRRSCRLQDRARVSRPSLPEAQLIFTSQLTEPAYYHHQLP